MAPPKTSTTDTLVEVFSPVWSAAQVRAGLEDALAGRVIDEKQFRAEMKQLLARVADPRSASHEALRSRAALA